MEALYIIFGLVIYIIGVVTGVYMATQIEKDINKRIKK